VEIAKILKGYAQNVGIEVDMMPLLILHRKRVRSSQIRELLKVVTIDLASLILDKESELVYNFSSKPFFPLKVGSLARCAGEPSQVWKEAIEVRTSSCA
jgi:hypothetical protein